ncbi:MAG: hypothetical protein AB1295_04465 [Candidatus Micrarchaeota archaeon]
MEGKYVVLFALFLVPSVFALGPQAEDIQAERLVAAMDNVECKAQFMVGTLESMMEHVDGAGYLQDDIDTINDDVETLQDYVDDGDNAAFWQYSWGGFTTHMREAKQNLAQARMGGNYSIGVMKELRDDYDILKAQYEACNFESAKRFGQGKVDAYELVLETADDKIERLEEKGIETSGLSQLVGEARSEVIDPLQDALDDAETHAEVREALRGYCLFNGCPEGSNFHFAARFEIEKVDSILDAISSDAVEAGLGDEVETAEGHIGDAQDVLDAVGSEQYSGSQHEDMWDSIRSAADAVKDILSALRSV